MTTPKKIVLTGARGFIGTALLNSLSGTPVNIHALVRRYDRSLPADVTQHVFDDLATASRDELFKVMKDADCLVHLASVVPGKHKEAAKNKTVDIAKTIAAVSADTNIEHIIVLSSVYAMLAEQGSPRARPYGREKLAADQIFAKSLPQSKIIFLRPPVVYGNGMSGSLLTLAKLISKGVWLPLALAKNRRSYISIVNLVDILRSLVDLDDRQWQAINQRKYVPTDGQPVSTFEIVNAIADGLGLRARMFPVPIWCLRLIGVATGKAEVIGGAIEPLLFDDNDALLRDFGWRPLESFPSSHGSWPKQAINLSKRPST